jgi:Xaa-Pro aminopeptidase
MRLWESRVKKIFDVIDEDQNMSDKPDLLVLKNGSQAPYFTDVNLFYITGFDHGLLEGSILIAPRDGPCELVVGRTEESTARQQADGINLVVIDKLYAAPLEKYTEPLSKFAGARAGFNFEALSQQDFLILQRHSKFTKMVDISKRLQRARRVKDAVEIGNLREACRITVKAYEALPEILRSGVTEIEVAAQLNYEMQRAGASGPSFDPIVAFGPNSAEPHYSPGKNQLKRGDFILVDYGCNVKRYGSDFTRTMVFGQASNLQKEMHADALAAMEAVVGACQAGVSGRHAEEASKEIVNKSKFKNNFLHGTGGHSIGLVVHDGIAVSETSSDALEENMVVTVEPGIYLQGVGGVRIEDDLIVRKGAPEIITPTNRDLIEIG